ncbi:MAG: hypothetical protein ACLQVD_07935, partial [Capsulimonadaceae bacterium]
TKCPTQEDQKMGTILSKTEEYLGDGLYVRFDGYQVWLRAPRERIDHEVALEPKVLNAFDVWRERLKKEIKELHSTNILKKVYSK